MAWSFGGGRFLGIKSGGGGLSKWVGGSRTEREGNYTEFQIGNIIVSF